MNKLTNLNEAAELVNAGDMLALGGMTLYRRPFAFVRSLIVRHQATGMPDDLTLLAFTASLESDWLVGAGLVNRVRTCYFGLEIFGFAPMFTVASQNGQLDVIEETEASLAFGLRATLAGVGFMPGRGWLGTDLPKLRPDICTITDPYTQEELIAFPAIRPDVAVIHALQADNSGNALIGKNKGIDEELALSARTVIITADQILPELHEADIVAPFVDAVVHAPQGAAPASCHPLYPLDGNAILNYTERVSDKESFSVYLRQVIAPLGSHS